MTAPGQPSQLTRDPAAISRRRALRLAMLFMGWSMATLIPEDEAEAGIVRTLKMEVTGYCPCPICCGPGAQGITASGRPVSHNGGRFVAADKTVFGFGRRLIVPGYAGERPVPVLDRGGAIKGLKLDVFFSTHEQAKQWGRKFLDVQVLRGG